MREGWIECEFQDCLGYIQPTKYIVESTEYDDAYEIPVLTAGKSFIKGYTNEKKGTFKSYPVIIFDDFTTASKFVNFEFKVKSSAMKILSPTSQLVNLKFIYHCMQVNQIRSDTHKRYWISVYAKKRFFLPPLSEQRAIVSKIEQLFSELDNGISNLKKAQEQLKIYRQSVLKKAFEGELTKEWREKQTNLPTAEELLKQIKEEREKHYQQQLEDWKKAVDEWEAGGKEGKKPGKPKKAKELPPLTERDLIGFPKVPSTWIYEKIGNICSCIVPNRDKPKTFSGKTKWVTTPDLNEKGIKIHYSIIKMGLTEEEIIKYNARVIPLNSIIMTCVGILGVSAIVEQKIVVNQQLHAFLPEKHYSPHLLAYYIRFSKVYFEKASTSTTVQYLNKDKCNSLPFAISNIQEQNQIVQEIESRLSVCDKLEESIKESLEKSEALRQSVLKKAFEGNLLTESELNSCRKEPDWETAEKLLERIKKEKEELNNPQKTKKKKVKA